MWILRRFLDLDLAGEHLDDGLDWVLWVYHEKRKGDVARVATRSRWRGLLEQRELCNVLVGPWLWSFKVKKEDRMQYSS